eukprot:CAMPEP_0114513280 /NCGR_PEP_ID=MMETSP0109-20121206/15471_1 /TAXON_ID=29199 /ORGANISM="Chlorarachnion reptans, Strain CCCM449" /LENGTH=69 /DNA_ID=CAMNT_0001693113 /DNA_START=237 /DNA_END=446 /DNA_ORIENTATION=-
MGYSGEVLVLEMPIDKEEGRRLYVEIDPSCRIILTASDPTSCPSSSIFDDWTDIVLIEVLLKSKTESSE